MTPPKVLCGKHLELFSEFFIFPIAILRSSRYITYMLKKEEQERKEKTARMWAARRARWDAWKKAQIEKKRVQS